MAEPRCERWATEGLLARERGEALDPHFESCADCRVARAADDALAARLQTEGESWQPPGDWEARVFARIAREAPKRRFAWWYAIFPALAAAAVAVWVMVPRGGGAPGELSLGQSVEDAQQVVRGDNPKPGDVLNLKVGAGGARRVGLRVYRDDRNLVYACGGAEAPCTQSAGSITAKVPLAAPGEYHTLLLAGEAELPAPAGSLDADVAAARAAGLRVVVGKAVRVY